VHVPEGTAIQWSSNPPATGQHYPTWARWNQLYDEPPCPRGHWVHNLEHGGVALLYRCPGGCDDVVTSLRALEASLPADPKCVAPVRTRTLVSADAELPADTQVAAAAWGWTYTARCFDEATLRAFVDAHYAQAPEDLCGDGTFPP
jgi:hypothetical protein